MLQLLYRCKWRGIRCDIAKDFTTTLSGFGVCYTFNHRNDSEILSVSQSGKICIYCENDAENIIHAMCACIYIYFTNLRFRICIEFSVKYRTI